MARKGDVVSCSCAALLLLHNDRVPLHRREDGRGGTCGFSGVDADGWDALSEEEVKAAASQIVRGAVKAARRGRGGAPAPRTGPLAVPMGTHAEGPPGKHSSIERLALAASTPAALRKPKPTSVPMGTHAAGPAGRFSTTAALEAAARRTSAGISAVDDEGWRPPAAFAKREAARQAALASSVAPAVRRRPAQPGASPPAAADEAAFEKLMADARAAGIIK